MAPRDYAQHEHLHCKTGTSTRYPNGSAYTPAQITTYLQHIRFPARLLPGPRDLRFLTALHAHQIATVPYENLSLHYSASHSNSLAPQAVFAKFVTPAAPEQRGRGGYCLETAVFYLHVLLALGFDAYPSLARIRLRVGAVPRGPFVGFRHVTNIVRLGDGGRWSCDVGFGGDGATGPMLLTEEDEGGRVRVNLGSQEVRVVRGPMPADDEMLLGPEVEATLKGRPAWFYQYRNGRDKEWNSYYAFGDGEATMAEMEKVNAWVSLSPDSFQRGQILVVKYILAGKELEDGMDGKRQREEVPGLDNLALERIGAASWLVADVSSASSLIAGKLMVFGGVVKGNLGGKTAVVEECTTEAERVAALRRYFGIGLTGEQAGGIRGFHTELRG